MFACNTEFSEVILLFSKNSISKQMPYSEFEAVLDSYATIPEFGGREAKAAYVVVDFSLNITACVFFLVEFCDDGSVSASWNIPLRHMAEIAGLGPDLGSGPIRLVCRSQCPIAWQRNATWDPRMSAQVDDFKMMVAIIKENRLCLPTQASGGHQPQAGNGRDTLSFSTQQPAWMVQPNSNAAPGVMPQHWSGHPASQWGGSPPSQHMPQGGSWSSMQPAWQQSPAGWAAPSRNNYPADQMTVPHARTPKNRDANRSRTAALLRKLKLKVTTLENAKNKEIAELQFEHQKQVQHAKIQKRRLQSFINSLSEQNEALKDQLISQKSQIQALEKSVETRLERAAEHEKQEITQLKQSFQKRLEENEVEEIAQLKETCQVKEMELLYKEEITNQLREEVVSLRRQKVRLLDSGANNFLTKLESLGMSFINYHPGAGHLSIPLEDMNRYMEDTDGYVAEKCLVSREAYQKWKAHYNDARCQCEISSGQKCGARVARVQEPPQYIEGQSDRCDKHKKNRRVANDPGYHDNVDNIG